MCNSLKQRPVRVRIETDSFVAVAQIAVRALFVLVAIAFPVFLRFTGLELGQREAVDELSVDGAIRLRRDRKLLGVFQVASFAFFC